MSACLYFCQISSFPHRIVLSSVAFLAIPYFSTLFHEGHNFLKIFIEHKLCVFIFSTTIVRNISHSKKKAVRYLKYM